MSSLVRAFLSSSLGTGLSRVLGLLRDLALASALGAGLHSDAFLTAFRIPGVFRRFVADEGLTGALVPGVAKAEKEADLDEARRLAGRVLTALLALGLVISVAAIAGAPFLVDLFAKGFRSDPAKFALTVELTRIMVPFVVTVSLVSWAEGLLNHKNHFFVPKLAPGVVSAAIVLAAWWPGSDNPLRIARVVSWAVIAGGVAHVLVCLPPLIKHWGWLRPRLDGFSDPRFQAMMRELGKVAVIGIMAQINIIVIGRVASFLQEGSLTWYWYGVRVVDVAQGIIAVGVGSAMLPALSKAVAGKDWAGFERAFVGSVRLAAALLLPAAAYLVVLAQPTVAVLFQRGAFTAADVGQTADALQVLIPYMLGLAAIQILKKPFFALERRNELMAVGGVGVLLTGGLGTWWGGELGVVGLCWALSVSTVLQALAYLVLLRMRVGDHLGLGPLASALLRMSAACLPAVAVGVGIAQLGTWEDGPTLQNTAVLAAAGVAGGGAYVGAAMVLGIHEIQAIIRRVTGRLRRS